MYAGCIRPTWEDVALEVAVCLSRKNVLKRHIRSCGRPFLPCVAWNGGPVVEFRFLHSVVAGSISSGGDHGMHC